MELLLFILIFVGLALVVAAALLVLAKRIGGKVGLILSSGALLALQLFDMTRLHGVMACGEWQARGEKGPNCEGPASFLVPLTTYVIYPFIMSGLVVSTILLARQTPVATEARK